jgi:hypothetical protein
MFKDISENDSVEWIKYGVEFEEEAKEMGFKYKGYKLEYDKIYDNDKVAVKVHCND